MAPDQLSLSCLPEGHLASDSPPFVTKLVGFRLWCDSLSTQGGEHSARCPQRVMHDEPGMADDATLPFEQRAANATPPLDEHYRHHGGSQTEHEPGPPAEPGDWFEASIPMPQPPQTPGASGDHAAVGLASDAGPGKTPRRRRPRTTRRRAVAAGSLLTVVGVGVAIAATSGSEPHAQPSDSPPDVTAAEPWPIRQRSPSQQPARQRRATRRPTSRPHLAERRPQRAPLAAPPDRAVAPSAPGTPAVPPSSGSTPSPCEFCLEFAVPRRPDDH